METNLQIGSNYANPWEELYNTYKNSPRFDERQFERYFNAGEAQAFFGITKAIEDLSVTEYDRLSKKYRFDLADSDFRFSALAHELFPDTDPAVKTFENEYLDEYGQKQVETFTGTNQQYQEKLLLEVVKNYEAEEQVKLAREAKEQWRKDNAALAFFTDVATIPAELVGGIMSTIDGITGIIGGIGEGLYSTFTGGNFLEGYSEATKTGKYAAFDSVRNTIASIESNYTFMRDIDGNYSAWGKYIGGLMSSAGKAIPTMLLNMIPGAGPVMSKISTGAYYLSMGQNDFRELLNDPNMASVPVERLILNSAMRTAGEYLVQKGLSKIMGASTLDKLVLGDTSKAVVDISKSGALFRILSDFIHEGTEEVLQDMSSYLINKLFATMDEEFDYNNEFNSQTIFDAFILGGLSSLGGSLLSLTKSFVSDFKYRKDADFKGFLTNWQFKNVFSELDNTYKAVMANSKNMSKSDLQTAANAMYFSFESLSEYYGNVGPERMQRAYDLLTRVEQQTKYGDIDAARSTIKLGAEYVASNIDWAQSHKLDLIVDEKEPEKKKGIIETLKEKFRRNKMTEVSKVVTEQEVTEQDLSSEIDKIAKEVMKATNTNKVAITKDGTGSFKNGKLVAVPEKELTTIAKEVAEKEITERIISNQRFIKVKDKLVTEYKKAKGVVNVDDTRLVYTLLYDVDFQRNLLGVANKQVYELMSVLDQLAKEQDANTAYDAILKKQLTNAQNTLSSLLVEYCVNQQNANYEGLSILTDKQKADIAKRRFAKNLANRIVQGDKVTKAEWNSLELRVNSIPYLSSDAKKEIINKLHSENMHDRINALTKIDNAYKGVFLSKYDNIHFLIPLTIQNNTLNSYMESHAVDGELISSMLSGMDNSVFASNDYFKYLYQVYGQAYGTTMQAFDLSKAVQDDFNNFTGNSMRVSVYNNQLVVTSTNLQGDYSGMTDDKLAVLVENRMSEVLTKNDRPVIDKIVGNKKALYDVTQIITDTSIELSKGVQQILDSQFEGRNTPMNRLYAIREYLTNTSMNTVVVMRDGSYAIADLTPSVQMLVDKGVTAKKIVNGEKLSKYIKSKYLKGLGKNVIVKLTANSSQYVAEEGVVYLATKGVSDKVFRANLLHETQHVIQTAQGMNIGFDFEWTKYFTPKQIQKFVAQAEKYIPNLFKEAKNYNDKVEILANFVYYSTGEMPAYGHAGEIQTFYPFVIGTKQEGFQELYSITTPWGEVFEQPSTIKQKSKLVTDYKVKVSDLGLLDNEEFDTFRKLLGKGTSIKVTDEELVTLNNKVLTFWKEVAIGSGVSDTINYKEFLYRYCTPEIREIMIKKFIKDYGINVKSVEDLDGVKIPFIRITTSLEHYLQIPINSALVVPKADTLAFITDMISKKSANTYFIAGSFTTDDLMYYFGDFEQEGLLTVTPFLNSEIYEVKSLSSSDFIKLEPLGKLETKGFIQNIPMQYSGNIMKYEPSQFMYDVDSVFSDTDFNRGSTTVVIGPNGKYSSIDIVDLAASVNGENILPGVIILKQGANTEISASAYLSDSQIHTIWEFSNEVSNYQITPGEVIISFFNGKTITVNALQSEKSFRNEIYSKFYGTTQRSKKIKEEKVRVITEEEQKKLDAEKKAKQKKQYAERKRDSYIPNKYAYGTNFEYYIKTGKPIFISPDLQPLIHNADPAQMEPELWDMIGGEKKGTLTSEWQIYQYMRDNMDKMNDYTFRLIAKEFFDNKSIKSYAELKALVTTAPVYHALRVVALETNSDTLVNLKLNPEQAILFAQRLMANDKFAKIYEKALKNYFLYFRKELDISESELAMAMLNHYDDTIDSAAKAADIVKWVEASNYSEKGKHETSEQQAKDRHGETYAVEAEDASALNAFTEVEDLDLDKARQEVFNALAIQKAQKWAAEGLSQNKILTKINALKEKIYDASDEQIAKAHFRLQGNKVVARPITEAEVNDEREPFSQRTNMRTRAKANATRMIKSLRPKDAGRFLAENADLFDENLKLKRETYEGKSESELKALVDRIIKIREEIKAGAYQTKKALERWRKLERKNEKLQKEVGKINVTIDNGITKVITKRVIIGDHTVHIDSSVNMPEEVKHIFETSIDKFAKTDVKYLTEEGEQHMQMNLRSFLETNAEWLASLETDQVERVIQYFENMNILGDVNDTFNRKIAAFSVYTLAYIYEQANDGKWGLSKTTLDKIKETLAMKASGAGTTLKVFQSVLPMLKPEEIIFKQLTKQIGVTVRDSDVAALQAAIKSADIEKIKAAKKTIIDYVVKNYVGRKSSLFDKLWRLERVFMLSSPGTMVRNAVSNTLVTVGNNMSALLGELFTKKSKKQKQKLSDRFDNENDRVKFKQYILTGTKVTEDISSFIQSNFIENGLLKECTDGLTKYDLRGIERRSSQTVLTDMIVQSIKSKVFAANQFSTISDKKMAQRLSQVLNGFSKVVFKLLSDDRWVNRKAISYFGKMLTEDNYDTRKGLSTQALETFAEAYTLAVYDYMHKSSFLNNLEDTLRKKVGAAGFYAYKQIFPFASASWNWALEALRYSPAGLVKAIIDWHRMEKVADKLDIARQSGDKVISSRFTEYLTKRNIGKGVIGSVAFLAGVILAATGLAGIDKEDKQIKLNVFGLKVDISNIFGSSSIMAGIALAGMLYDDNMTFEDAFANTLSTMFNDMLFTGLFNSFRYNDSVGDWLLSQPSAMLGKYVPNFIKALSGIVNTRKVKYSGGFVGGFEALAVQSIPGLAYAFPAKVDPYTGKYQSKYKLSPLVEIVNRFGLLGGAKIYPYEVSDAEKEAISYGVEKGELTGNYSNLKEMGFSIDKKQKQELNEFYGKLNDKSLKELMKSNKKYKVQMPDGTHKKLTYKQMSDGQKKSIITRIMNDNASKAKIYIATKNGFKYYTSESEYQALKALGISNVYKQIKGKEGFVK